MRKEEKEVEGQKGLGVGGGLGIRDREWPTGHSLSTSHAKPFFYPQESLANFMHMYQLKNNFYFFCLGNEYIFTVERRKHRTALPFSDNHY